MIQLPRDTLNSPEAVWSAMTQRLGIGDSAGATSYFASSVADDYRQTYLAIGVNDISPVIQQIPAISPIFIQSDNAQYYFQEQIDGVTITFLIDFVEENGTWKILEY